MNKKTQILSLALLSIAFQHNQILSQTNYGYGSTGSNYNQSSYNSNPQGQNPGYYQQEQNYNNQGENYYRGSNGYMNADRRANGYDNNNYNNNQMRNDQNRGMRNMRAESDATPHSYPLEDMNQMQNRSPNNNYRTEENREETAYYNRTNNNQNSQGRQFISDNATMTPNANMSTPMMRNNAYNKETVIEVLSKDPSFSTLVQAITAAGLLDTLNAKGPFTIFAPNNQAFQKLSADQLKDLMKPENKQKLASILKFHVVPGKIMAADVVTAKVNSVQGKPLDIKNNGSKITVNNANVVKADMAGSNGVIHTIDTVLMP